MTFGPENITTAEAVKASGFVRTAYQTPYTSFNPINTIEDTNCGTLTRSNHTDLNSGFYCYGSAVNTEYDGQSVCGKSVLI